eukprot:TRINITY_DN20520_c0_g1_i3.p2 TRINITY_DN20520_c0_g1~~TRINITY_DN20520_c0_g1_i3.p2  ORF type:complete len:106 (-),score=20.37 TRINITY_DN20520_c0_g1_i3:184-501(-)
MTAFMLWMSGSSLQIFSLIMLSMSLWNPISAILDIQTAFAKYSDSNIDLTLPKLKYVAANLCGLSLALYKCYTMGLLPTSVADIVSSFPPPVSLEFTSGSVVPGN